MSTINKNPHRESYIPHCNIPAILEPGIRLIGRQRARKLKRLWKRRSESYPNWYGWTSTGISVYYWKKI